MQQDNKLDGWCLFIDLLGVRYLAQANPATLFYHFSEFFNQLETIAESRPDCKVFPLSDSAFIYSNNLSSLIKLIQNLRPVLFSEGIYFKGAICAGSADLRWPRQNSQVHGVSFSGVGPAEAYSMQAALNGIGISVGRPKSKMSEELAEFNQALDKGEIFKSAFLSSHPKKSINPYYEVSLTTNEIGKNFNFKTRGKNASGVSERTAEGFHAISKILQSYWYTKHLDERTATKFISFLISISLNSSIESIRYDENSKTWLNASPLFVRAFIDSGTIDSLNDSSFNPIFAIIACRIIHDVKLKMERNNLKSGDIIDSLILDPTVSRILSTTLKRRGLVESLSKYPDDIIMRESSDLFFILYSRRKDIKKINKRFIEQI